MPNEDDRLFEGTELIRSLDLLQSQIPVPKYQELVSEMVARKLLRVFEVSTIGMLIAGGIIIIVILHLSYTPQDAEALIEKAVVPFLRGAATFATTVFGPLLAFILGFYFGKTKE